MEQAGDILPPAAASGSSHRVGRLGSARSAGGWPLHRYLVGLVVLFVAAGAAGVVYGWITADRDARTAAVQDAGFGARLAATEVGGDVSSIRDSVTALAGNPGIGQAFATPAGCSLQVQLPGGSDAGAPGPDPAGRDGGLLVPARRGRYRRVG